MDPRGPRLLGYQRGGMETIWVSDVCIFMSRCRFKSEQMFVTRVLKAKTI